MTRILYLFVLLSGTFSSVLAAASAEDLSPQELTRRYMSVLGRTEGIPEITTSKEGFDYIVQSITRLSGKPHTHVDSGLQYGFSFVQKNIPPVEFMKELMTGTKSWKKEQILSRPVSIADIGCGLGFSAAYFVSEVVKVYDSEPGWTFTSPMVLDLYDISPEHQNALQPLASLINEAYPQYFHVETFVQDAGEAFRLKKYRAIFALNLMHYVPEPKWPAVMQNIEELLEDNGMLFVTTDHYHTPTWTAEQCQRLEGAAKERAENPSLSPFVSSYLPLVNPRFGDQYQTRTLNSSFNPFLKDPKGYVPGAPKRIEDIDIEAVGPILRRSSREHLKSKETVGLYDGEKQAEMPVEEVMDRLKEGRLFIQLGNYGFDENLLEKGILASSKGTLKRLKISSWTKNLLQNRDGYPTSVGLTFTKK